MDDQLERDAIARVVAHRAGRNQDACDAALAALGDAARGTQNLMPLIVAAAEADATVGEICGAMKTVFGDYQAASGLGA